MTGGVGSGVIDDTVRALFPWPPAMLLPNNVTAASLPTYTQTGTIPTLAAPTFTKPGGAGTFDAGDGWYNDADNVPDWVPVEGCRKSTPFPLQ